MVNRLTGVDRTRIERCCARRSDQLCRRSSGR